MWLPWTVSDPLAKHSLLVDDQGELAISDDLVEPHDVLVVDAVVHVHVALQGVVDRLQLSQECLPGPPLLHKERRSAGRQPAITAQSSAVYHCATTRTTSAYRNPPFSTGYGMHPRDVSRRGWPRHFIDRTGRYSRRGRRFAGTPRAALVVHTSTTRRRRYYSIDRWKCYRSYWLEPNWSTLALDLHTIDRIVPLHSAVLASAKRRALASDGDLCYTWKCTQPVLPYPRAKWKLWRSGVTSVSRLTGSFLFSSIEDHRTRTQGHGSSVAVVNVAQVRLHDNDGDVG